MSKKEEYQGPIINSLQGELKPVDYSFIEELTKKAGVSEEYLKECEEIHKEKINGKSRKKWFPFKAQLTIWIIKTIIYP